PGQAEARRAGANLDHLARHGDRLQRSQLQRGRDRGGGGHEKQHEHGQPAPHRSGPPSRELHGANSSHPSSTLTTPAGAPYLLMTAHDAELGKQADQFVTGKIDRKRFISDQARESYDRITSGRPSERQPRYVPSSSPGAVQVVGGAADPAPSRLTPRAVAPRSRRPDSGQASVQLDPGHDRADQRAVLGRPDGPAGIRARDVHNGHAGPDNARRQQVLSGDQPKPVAPPSSTSGWALT